MKTRPACPGCGRAFRQGVRVFLAIAGALDRRIVCRECASRGFTIVIPETTKSVREVLAPFATHLHRLAKAYDGTERAEGLRQAADILAEGLAGELAEAIRLRAMARSQRPPVAVLGMRPRVVRIVTPERIAADVDRILGPDPNDRGSS